MQRAIAIALWLTRTSRRPEPESRFLVRPPTSQDLAFPRADDLEPLVHSPAPTPRRWWRLGLDEWAVLVPSAELPLTLCKTTSSNPNAQHSTTERAENHQERRHVDSALVPPIAVPQAADDNSHVVLPPTPERKVHERA